MFDSYITSTLNFSSDYPNYGLSYTASIATNTGHLDFSDFLLPQFGSAV
jgi:hypothetical protein